MAHLPVVVLLTLLYLTGPVGPKRKIQEENREKQKISYGFVGFIERE